MRHVTQQGRHSLYPASQAQLVAATFDQLVRGHCEVERLRDAIRYSFQFKKIIT